ncbi:hypothetical protein [Roseomonas indoligenes]|uniref:PH domain-containing protein n=1 Tax=Roseomonas indoligenes TaxID=2820811 RepID=A0A940MRW0_9PROT|nr:hypothetical protein [Pararoseomonas indoligenes]MBP0492903.1 hypothetical protein [Pararoseomonas indoligenes]
MKPERPAFVAYPNRRSMVVVIAAMAPLVSLILAALVVHPAAPLVLRIISALIAAPIVVWMVLSLILALQRRPLLVIDAAGVTWSRWSDRPIPWNALEHWQRRRYINSDFVTIWLKDPAAYRPGPLQRFQAWGNRGLGFGHLTLSGGGMDRSFTEMAQAFADFAPKPPLPDDPRLARRLAAARARNGG